MGGFSPASFSITAFSPVAFLLWEIPVIEQPSYGAGGYTFNNVLKVKRRRDGEFAMLTLL